MTREELIEFLVINGYKATPRDWAMGETVLVHRIEAQAVGDIPALPGATYCWPIGKQLAMLDPPGFELRFDSKEALLKALVAHFDACEAFFWKNHAGQRAMEEARAANRAARDVVAELEATKTSE